MLATSIDGRPIKVEGNPRHPASLGATDIFAEAEIMALYDPDRAKAPRHNDDISSWDAFAGALRAQMEREQGRRGAGLRIVTGRVTSPTLLRQLDGLLRQFPQARWYAYEAVSEDAAVDGSVMAYGRRLSALPRIADAAVVLALDADPLGPGPSQIVNARGFAERRRRNAQPYLRLYAVEPDWSLTGANADHRLALHPHLIGTVALAIAAALQGEGAPDLPAAAARFAHACAADLKANSGRALVLVGPRQPAPVHALAHWLNAQLKAPVDLIAPVDGNPLGDAEALRALSRDLDEGRVATLIIAGANPAYDTPANLRLADKIKTVAFTAQLGLHDDETGALCHWQLPLSHTLESWSDLRAADGTASIAQPLIRPLYDSRDAHAVFAMLAGEVAPSAYDLVRQTWRPQAPDKFDAWWKQALHDGVIANSAAPPVAAGTPKRPDLKPAAPPEELSLALSPDTALWDGRFANNAWLQECPHPFTKDVWGNAIHLSPADARHSGISDGELVVLKAGAVSLWAPARIRDGQAERVIALTLGHGRSRAGRIGSGIGVNAYALRTLDAPRSIEKVALTATGQRRPLPSLQEQFRLEGADKDLYPMLTLAELAQGKRPNDRDEIKPTLNPDFQYDSYAWAMVIDTSLCIGCNACVVACQAENNVPVVGPEEIARGRDMHWLRIDRYSGDSQTRLLSRCPACIASMRRASRSARWPPRCTTAKGSMCRSTTAASARGFARPIVPTKCAASTGSAMPTARNMPISAPIRSRPRTIPTSPCARAGSWKSAPIASSASAGRGAPRRRRIEPSPTAKW